MILLFLACAPESQPPELVSVELCSWDGVGWWVGGGE